MPPPTLEQLQRWMRWMITEPRGVRTALSHPRHEPQPSCLQWVVDSGNLSAESRLDIYAEGYFIRIAKGLARNFSLTFDLIGEEKFFALIADYLQVYPSKYTTIEDVGSNLPLFSRTHRLSTDFKFLPDLMSLERMITEAFHAHDCPALDVSHFMNHSPDSLITATFKLHPSVSLMVSSWPLYDIWSTGLIPNTISDMFENILIYRQQSKVKIEVINSEQFTILNAIKQGQTLEQICQSLVQQFANTEALSHIQHWFKQWIETGIIVEIN